MAEGIKWDPNSQRRFSQRLEKLRKTYPTATEQCAGAIGERVLLDAARETPTVPVDTGTLLGSGTYEVFGGAHWREAKIVAGFNTHYAARVHQVPMNFKQPSAGNYFLSSKLQRNGAKYIQIWTACVSRRLGMN